MALTKTRAWPNWLFRIFVTLQALLVLTQAVLAGGFLSGHYEFFDLHELGGMITAGVGALVVVSTILVWKPGGGPPWPIAASVGVLVATVGVVGMGFARLLTIHVPLAVLLTVGVVLLLGSAWRAPARTEP